MGNKKTKLNYKQQKEMDEILAKKRKHERKMKFFVIPGIIIGLVLITGISIWVSYYIKSSGYLMRNTTALKSEHFTVDNAMMTFYANDTYKSYLENFYDSLAESGLDTEKELSKQYQSDGVTWSDYFIDITEKTVKDVLVIAEEAYSKGHELSKKEQEQLDSDVAEINLEDFPLGLNKDDIRRALELYRFAFSFDDKLYNSFSYTEQQLDKYRNENEKYLVKYDYLYYSFYYGTDGDTTEYAMSEDEAEKYAKELSLCKSEEEFSAYLLECLKATYPSIPEDSLEQEIENSLVIGAYYEENDPFSEWMLESNRKSGESYLYNDKENNAYTVYFLLSTPEIDESQTVNVRHILFKADTNEQLYTALDNAADTLVKWEENGCSEEELSSLAAELSEDHASAENGGLYENIVKGEMVESFDNWCFDESRKKGDYEIIKSDYGYHIMYFVGYGCKAWQVQAREKLLEEDYIACYEDFHKKYTVSVVDKYRKYIRL